MRKRITNEEYIIKANKVHNNFYNYTKTEYTLSINKIIITCPDHGDFFQEANSHLSGIGCPKCSGRYRYKNEEFIKLLKSIHGDKYDYSKVIFKNAHSKIKIICPIHGEFEQTAHNHKNGFGCNKCGFKSVSDKLKMLESDFIKRCNELHNNYYDYSFVLYENMRSIIKIKCPIHGYFTQLAKAHIFGQGCPKCGVIKASKSKTKSKDEFIKQSNEIHNEVYDYSNVEYLNDREKINIVCSKHGVFKQQPNKHLMGQGCPSCCESKLEKSIRKLLEENKIDFISQYGKKQDIFYLEGQLLDFYLPEYKLAIECQGEQHFNAVNFSNKDPKFKFEQFEKNKFRDNKKYEKCKEFNVEIFYFTENRFSNIEYLGFLTSNKEELLIKIKEKNESK